MERWPAVELATTIHYDGKGSLTDDLTTVEGLDAWLRARAELLPTGVPQRDAPGDPAPAYPGPDAPAPAGSGRATTAPAGRPVLTVDEDLRLEVVAIRRAVRALFARAVSPGPPSRADAHRLMPAGQALDRLNAAAALDAVTPRLDWPPDGTPQIRWTPASHDPRVRLVAALARAALDFLGGPQRELLRACDAPGCVRYFVKSHGRQEWCKPSCGNRARAARHYDRRRRSSEDAPAGS